jgi:hypothetical protein
MFYSIIDCMNAVIIFKILKKKNIKGFKSMLLS